MARIVAAYIAHGRRRADYSPGAAEFPIDNNLRLEWQRLFCLFALVRKLTCYSDPPRLILIADHLPPTIGGRLMKFYFELLNVEFYRQDHMWRPDYAVVPGDYFIFDALEKLKSLSTGQDQILLFGSRSLAVHPLDNLFQSLDQSDAIFVEESTGDLVEDHIRAIRERSTELRRTYGGPCPSDAVLAVSPQFIGLTHARLSQIVKDFNRLFAISLSRANKGDDYLSRASEMLAALFAISGIFQPPSSGLSGHAAAMPDDFEVAQLPEIPVIVPGYGREPDIMQLFSILMPDRLRDFETLDIDIILKEIQTEKPDRSISNRFRGWFLSN